jgi:Fe-S-cluster containining protein
MTKKRIIVPDYYKDFKCKCGACRACCCEGWGITVSDNEYFTLIGTDCSKELRWRLDSAFCSLESPSPQRYALLKPNYFGKCRMLDESGMCMIHKECGEEILPLICKMYPRSVLLDSDEGACANSCEAVLELLFASKEKLSFYETEVVGDFKEVPTSSQQKKNIVVQKQTIELLQDRGKTMTERIASVGEMLAPYAGNDVLSSSVSTEKSQSEGIKTVLKIVAEFDSYSQSFRNLSSL